MDSNFKHGDLPPKERTFIPPEGGLKPSRYYVVDVSVGRCNPIHRAILYSGFVPEEAKKGFDFVKGGYCCLLSATSDYYSPYEAYYMKVLHEIPGLGGVHGDGVFEDHG